MMVSWVEVVRETGGALRDNVAAAKRASILYGVQCSRRGM
jgi:hypothetical protein